MSLGRFVRWVAPSALVSAVERLRTQSNRTPVWSGAYTRFDEVPVTGPGYDGESWLESTRLATREVIKLTEHGRWPAAPQHAEYALLSLLIATQDRGPESPTRVLDIGGGMGVSYLHAKAAAIDCSVDYHIVERPEICREAPQVVGLRDDLTFHPSLDEELPQFDIVYMSGVLQYIDDFRAMLRRVTNLGARQILITKINAGSFPTYATAQTNVSGSVIACWFFNLEELVGELESAGYSLLFKATDVRRYDQTSVPTDYRMARPCHLLFNRVR